MTVRQGAILQFVENLLSPFRISLPRLTFQALAVLFLAAPPGIAPSQNPPANNKPEGTVQT
jgi:hypothetical protein